MQSTPPRPVLILGAGINGAAVARELVLNGVPVWLVDRNDIARGATSRSSRLIHGGLRYLEYGDFQVVRESLEERSRLRRLAPQFVEPLRLYIPVSRRTGGAVHSLVRFLRRGQSPLFRRLVTLFRPQRGRWLVQIGLWLYQHLVRDPEFPSHRVQAVSAPSVPRVDANKYRWLCGYTDARMQYPERFVLALLEDARQSAAEQALELRVLTYHQTVLRDGKVEIRRRDDVGVGATSPLPAVQELHPPVIVNATGAWGDLTLEQLNVPSRRLFGGTKGSHFVSHHPGLQTAVGGNGVYAEAPDGRLVFVLPFGKSVLVGTTEEQFDAPPEQAVASPAELDYLIGMVNDLFPQLHLTADDIDMHYSGVRPLPHASVEQSGSISRDHWIERSEAGETPVLTLVGGKLTTCRSFAEQVADEIFARLGIERTAETRARPVPGGIDYPADAEALHREWERLAERFGMSVAQIRAVWSLCGNRVEAIFCERGGVPAENLAGTDLPLEYVRWVVEHEWVTTLDDLIERRLMLVAHPGLSERLLRELAACLVEAKRLEPSQVEPAVDATITHLREHYGKIVVRDVA